LRRPSAAGALATVLLAASLSCTSAPPPAAAAVPKAPSEEFFGLTPATPLDPSEAARIGRAGTGTIRALFYWPAIEPEPPGPVEEILPVSSPGRPQFDWERTDTLVRRAAENGMRVLPFVMGTPDWIAADPMRPPLDGEVARAEWGEFLGAVVGRYGPQGEFWTENPDVAALPVTSWQIWNEQNDGPFWSPAPSASEYADLIQLSAAAIRSVDPRARLVLGGMFGTPSRGTPAWTFLERLYAVGGVESAFDAYALHPYSPSLAGIEAQVRLARKALAEAGEPRLPLLITEIGWPTDGPAGYDLVKSPAGQKRMLARSFRLFVAERRRWRLRRVIWYTWRDNDVQPGCTVCRFSGLVDRDLNPKPAWRKFARFAGGAP
jgi:hypothetical protein